MDVKKICPILIFIMIKQFLISGQGLGSIVVEPSTHDLKIEGLIPAPDGTGREKIEEDSTVLRIFELIQHKICRLFHGDNLIKNKLKPVLNHILKTLFTC
jgi:hypothetical protein